MPSQLSTKLMNAYMSGTSKDVSDVQAEIASYHTVKKKNVRAINTILNDDQASAISVYDFMNKAFGVDWHTWEIETIEQVLFINYGIALEEVNRDKLLAIRHLCNSDKAFHDWFEFNQLALSFAGAIADFEMLRAPSPGMVISAVRAMSYIRPDVKSFGDDTLKYMCIILIDEGLYAPPPSILALIKKSMMGLVSDDMKSDWINILKRYNEIVTKKNTEIKENVIDIQAKRLVNAEAAALTYSN